jgi:hypothetical protein
MLLLGKGGCSAELNEPFEVSVGLAVRWVQRWHESKSAAPFGGDHRGAAQATNPNQP